MRGESIYWKWTEVGEKVKMEDERVKNWGGGDGVKRGEWEHAPSEAKKKRKTWRENWGQHQNIDYFGRKFK